MGRRCDARSWGVKVEALGEEGFELGEVKAAKLGRVIPVVGSKELVVSYCMTRLGETYRS